MNLEFNKIAASILLAGVIAMVSGTIAKIVYGSESHGDHAEKRGYSIEVTEGAAPAGAAAPVVIDKGALLAAAKPDPAAVKKCLTCHSFEKGGPAKVGPNLYGVLGGKHAHMAGFQYSKAMSSMSGNWDVEGMWNFLNNPAKTIAGTKMAFAGLKKPEEIAAAIAYINSMSDKPVSFPAPAAK